MRARGPAPGFWSRRRAAVSEEARREAEGVRTADAAPEAAVAVAHGAPAAEPGGPGGPLPEGSSEQEVLAALGLPDPDAMGAGDDFSAFMARAVPAALRRRALRRLWTSRPVLANLDRLVDYDDDFTGGGVPMGTLPTAYRVGRGFLAEVERMAEEASPERTAPTERSAVDAGARCDPAADAAPLEPEDFRGPVDGRSDRPASGTTAPPALAGDDRDGGEPVAGCDEPRPLGEAIARADAAPERRDPPPAHSAPARRRMRFEFA